MRDTLPRDGTGKLLRHALRVELWEGRESVFANPGSTDALHRDAAEG